MSSTRVQDIDSASSRGGGGASALNSRRGALVLGLPPVAWITILLFAPYLYMVAVSLWQVNPANPYLPMVKTWNLDNYAKLFQEPAYLTVLLRSLRFGVIATVVATLLGFPVAYYLAFKVKRHRMLLYMLVILPLWASYLVRAYAWKVVLGDNGVLTSFLAWTGLIDHPEELLYSSTAVVIALTQMFTPFMILAAYTTLERIPRSLHEASYDLGVSRVRTFFRITVPLSLPGVLAGAFFTVGLATGEFVAPTLVGGPNDTMIAQLIQQQFGTVNNKPFAAAISVVMVALVMAVIYVGSRFERREQIES